MESSLITFTPFSSNPPQIKHHVYLSFRGEDTRYTFISHLEKALRDKQINTSNDLLDIGDEIGPSLLRAIEESKISLIVFSESYASSGWCLEELATILESREKYGQIVIPVFYGVAPSDVRRQTGYYADAFAKHHFKQSLYKVQRWKDSLTEAASLSGFDSRHIKPDSVLIDNIVDDVLKKLNNMSPSYDKDLVGIHSGIEQIENWLKRGDVRSATSLITSSSFSSNPPQITHHVYLSFRAQDTRDHFTGHLEKALRDKQIKTYIDDQLNIGDEISPSLLKAIEESQISVIVFSKDYASSRRCLEELVKILECREKHRQIVIPVFYGVDSSVVRNQTGSYANSFAKHVQRFKQSLDEVQRWRDSLMKAANISYAISFAKHVLRFKQSLDEVQRWRDSLKKAANISGFTSLVIRSDSVLIDNIVHVVLNKLNNMSRFKMGITNWVKGKHLGSGSSGSVYEGISDEGFFFAVKEVSLLDQGRQGKLLDQLEQEIAFLSQFEHENIVRYYGTYKDESKLYIFLELVTKGSLLNLYQSYPLPDPQVSAYTRQILHGLKYLHDRNVVHRDIKCANILVHASGSVKIADFGLAKATKLNDVKSCKGTPFWMAPEVVNNKNQGYGTAADIWSLGCTVLEMLTRQIPYSHLECMQALFQIGRGVPPPISDDLSKDAREFILKCLQTNPSDRPTAAQLLDHSFVKRPLTTFSG